MEQTAIYGTGTIGAGLATLLSGNGLPTLVVGRSRQSLDRCRGAVLRNWEDLISNGLAAPANRDAAMALLRFTADSALLADRSFVFEAVSEELSVKRHVYQAIEKVVGDDAVIASTTSSVDAELLAELVCRPERLLIAHPFQPAHLLPLVEVVRHRATAREITERTCSLLEYMGRQVVRLNRSVPGFLVNRLAQALFRESIHLIESGVTTAEDIDRAVKYAVGMRYASIGLLEYFDDVGFKLESAIAEQVYPDLCCAGEIQRTVELGLETGRTGLTAGQGFYAWQGRDTADYRRRKQAPFFHTVAAWHMPG